MKCKNRMTRTGLRGLTLLELVVVMTILIALAGILVALFPGFLRLAHTSTGATNLSDLNRVFHTYNQVNRGWPNGLDNLHDGTNLYSRLPGDPTSGNYYYTNSIHIAVDADVDYVERVEKQSRFHPLIDAGAIVHVWLGEHEPDPAAIRSFVEKTFRSTQCSQIAFSPEFTVCESCHKTGRGLRTQCTYCGSLEVYGVTRIVGYFSKVQTWNRSKVGELYDRVRTDLRS